MKRNATSKRKQTAHGRSAVLKPKHSSPKKSKGLESELWIDQMDAEDWSDSKLFLNKIDYSNYDDLFI